MYMCIIWRGFTDSFPSIVGGYRRGIGMGVFNGQIAFLFLGGTYLDKKRFPLELLFFGGKERRPLV